MTPTYRNQVETAFVEFAAQIRSILAVDQTGNKIPGKRPRFDGMYLPEDFKVGLNTALDHIKENELDQAMRLLGRLKDYLGAIQGKYLKQYCIQIINEKRDGLGKLGISQGKTHEDLRLPVDRKINEFQDFIEIRGKINLDHGSTLFWEIVDLIDSTEKKLRQRIQNQQRAAAEIRNAQQKAADTATKQRNMETRRRELNESLSVGARLETEAFAGIL